MESTHNDQEEDVPSTPTDKYQRQYTEPFDSTPKTNGNIFSSGKLSTKLVTPFGRRTDKFAMKFSINNIPNVDTGKKSIDHDNSEDDIISRVQPPNRCSLRVCGSGPEPGCRFMYDRIEDRVTDIPNNKNDLYFIFLPGQ